MGKVYQPIVLEYVENLILGLEDGNFFEDYEITDLTFAKTYILDNLTEKFINGTLDEDFEEMYTEEEFGQLLKEIVAGSVLYELKEKGYVNSYGDENVEEMFFLTDEGKKYMKDNEL